MAAVIQQLLVALIVAAALAVSVWKLMPARRRLKTLLALDARAAKRPAFAGLRARWLAPRIARAAGAGCDGCAANPAARAQQRPR